MKAQERFRSEKNDVFARKVNKIALSTNNDKKMQPINSTETCAYGASKDLDNLDWPQIFDRLYLNPHLKQHPVQQYLMQVNELKCLNTKYLH